MEDFKYLLKKYFFIERFLQNLIIYKSGSKVSIEKNFLRLYDKILGFFRKIRNYRFI